MTGGTVSYVAAFGGGIGSFLSLCVLPIVPAYHTTRRGCGQASGTTFSAHDGAGKLAKALATTSETTARPTNRAHERSASSYGKSSTGNRVPSAW